MGRLRNRVSLFIFAISAISAQNVVLSLGSGSGAPGGAVAVPITLTDSGGAQPAGIQWSFSYPAGITGVTVVAGLTATNAQKLLTCAGSTCIIYGLNANSITDGLAATATFQLAPGASGTIPISLTNVVAASVAADSIPASGGSGSIVVSVSASLSTVGCLVASIAGPGSTSCTVTLSAAAPAGGFQVSLSSNNANLTVPTSVTVAAGQTTATFSATGATVNADQTGVTITASAAGIIRTASVNLLAPAQLRSVSCSLGTIGSNATSTCTAALSRVAASSVSVSLGSNNVLLAVPGTVTIATGQAGATFSVNSGVVTQNQSATITASVNGNTQSFTMNLTASLQLSELSCSPTSFSGPGTATCTITLSGAAPSNTSTIVSSDNTAVTVPGIVTFNAGQSSATFSATIAKPSSNQIATISASLMTGSSRTASISLGVPSLSSVYCSPSTLNSNHSTTCTVLLDGNAVGSTIVGLASNKPNLQLPASVTVAAGSSTVTFSASASILTSNDKATVMASLNGQNLSTNISLVASSQISALTCTPTSLTSNGTAVCTVVLPQPAINPMVVAVSATLNTLTVPSAVTIASGQTSTSFSATAGMVTTDSAANISVSSNGQALTAQVQLSTAVQLYNPVTNQPGQACSPDAIATVVGSGFTNQTPQAAAGPSWPLQLAGVQLNVNDQPAPLLYASDTLIHFQCPALAPGTELRIVVGPDSAHPPAAVSAIMQEATPGVYTLDDAQQGSVLIAGTDLVASANSISRPGRPAMKGEYISIYADGLGPLNEILPPGEPAPLDRLIRATAAVTVVIGDSEVVLSPSFVGLTPGVVSLFVVNVQLTNDVQTGSSIPLYLKVTLSDGIVVNSNTVRIAVASSPAP